MHTAIRTVALALAAIALVVTTGCFEIAEQYHFNSDGSGKVVLDMGMSKQLAAFAESEGEDPWKDMRDDFEKNKGEMEKDPNIKSVSLDEKDSDEMHHFILTVEVHDMTKARDTMKGLGEGEDGPGGDTELTIAGGGGSYTLTRVVKMGDEDDGGEQEGAEFMKKMFAGRHYTVQVYGADVSGTGGEPKDGYVEFKKPLTDLMGAPEPWTIKASVSTGGGGTMLYIIIGVVVVAAVVGAVVVKGGKKKAA